MQPQKGTQMLLTSYFVPVIFGAVLLYGTYKKVPVFDAFLEGAKENLKLGVDLLPTLIALLTVVSLVKASGLTDLLTSLCAPFLSAVGFPAECIPLALIRPISGSGSLAVYESLLDSYGPDSTVGTIASVLQGSSETTFYTIALYYGTCGIRNGRHTLLCALCGDCTAFLCSSLCIRLFG